MQSTMKVAQADDELMSREKARTQAAYHERITALFRQVDTSGDGMIDVTGTAHQTIFVFCWFELVCFMWIGGGSLAIKWQWLAVAVRAKSCA